MACVRMWICDGCGKQQQVAKKERSAVTPPGWVKLTTYWTTGTGLSRNKMLAVCSSACASPAIEIMLVMG